MMDGFGDIQDLYQQVILDHGRRPRNFRDQQEAQKAEGFNPLCGDQVTVYVKLDDAHIGDCSFTGKGCAICTASASMMTQWLKDKSLAEAREMFTRFHEMLTAREEPGDGVTKLGKLAAFAGVRKYPIRVKCATLPWHTLNNALDNKRETASTE